MKKILILLSTTILILIGIIGYLKFMDYKTGNVEEREELLTAVAYDLFNEKNISLEKVKNIKIHRQEAGVYPFFYIAVVDLENGKTYRYKWANKNKSKLDIQ